MAIPGLKNFTAALEARKLEERALLLAIVVVVVGYGWLVLVSDRIDARREQLSLQVNSLNGQIAQEANRFSDIQRNYKADPNAFARQRQQALQEQTIAVDEQLRRLYGQLIQPRQMAQVLTSILQRETTLRLVSLENLAPSMLTSASVGAVTPLVGESAVAASEGLDAENGIQVYRHGLRMVFEGNYLETIRYLRSLENLDTTFFWQSLSYNVTEWPKANITLEIFTLSTRQEWIGV